MRILGIHADHFSFFARKEAGELAESLPEAPQEVRVEQECLVIFSAIEQGDEASPNSIVRQLIADIEKRSKQLGVKRIVLHPYVHLTDQPGSASVSLQILQLAEQGLLKQEYEVIRSPFGWYKSFTINCLGHPLSEWSAKYSPQEEDEVSVEVQHERKGSEFTKFVLVDLGGQLYEIQPEGFEQCPVFQQDAPQYKLLRQFVANEFGQGQREKDVPKHIEYMKRHDLVDYCDVSEKGHYKWYPKGLLIQRLLLDYAAKLAYDWGAFEMKNPLIIRSDHNLVGQLMGEFHERDYKVDGGRGLCYMRYASDPLAFPFMQNVSFSHKQSPLKVYEEASCFRNEQQGEVSGLKRVRNFLMTDMHAACASVEEAQQEFEHLCGVFAGLMTRVLTKGRWVLGWEGTIDFFEQHKAWLIRIGKELKVPAFFKLMPHMSHYYAMKNEFQAITADGSNVQISTVQWDVKDGERFDIGYIDEQGQKQACPVILHASSFGSIERALCSILENIAVDTENGVPPMFPFWLSPTHVRIVPVSDKHLAPAQDLMRDLVEHSVRVDIDDRDETLGRKIRDGEKEWIPYLVVMGDREISSEKLAVRERATKTQLQLSAEELVQQIRNQLYDLPFRDLMLPKALSQRPIFT